MSARKAEYVLDLAARFADGRLSTEKLVEADDDELARMLIEVRGIGRWTGASHILTVYFRGADGTALSSGHVRDVLVAQAGHPPRRCGTSLIDEEPAGALMAS